MNVAIPVSTIVSLAVAAFATFVLPLGIIGYLLFRRKILATPVVVGAGGFFVSQIILRLPLMQIMGAYPWYQQFAATALGIVVVGGLTAGLFEETARFLAARFLLRNNRTYNDAVAYGFGHAFCEVVLLIGTANLNGLIHAVAINNGSFEQTLLPALGAENANLLIRNLQSISPLTSLASVLERCSASIFHVFASVLVFQAVTQKKPSLYWAAVGLHTLLNGGASLLMRVGGIWVSEAFLFGFAVMFLFLLTNASMLHPPAEASQRTRA